MVVAPKVLCKKTLLTHMFLCSLSLGYPQSFCTIPLHKYSKIFFTFNNRKSHGAFNPGHYQDSSFLPGPYVCSLPKLPKLIQFLFALYQWHL